MEQTSRSMVLLVGAMVAALIDQPDKLLLVAVQQEGYVLLCVQVSPDDLGKVIGKQGRTARSLRTILGAAGMKTGCRFQLNILGGGNSAREENIDLAAADLTAKVRGIGSLSQGVGIEAADGAQG
jgi:predicted RNA-binding protein YlqC (UPF0109 family)